MEELRHRFYGTDEPPPALTLSPDNVPEALHGLMPLAARWGISDDILRSDARRRASTDEVDYLKSAVAHFDDALDEWLAGSEAQSERPTIEYLAFSNMRMAADGI